MRLYLPIALAGVLIAATTADLETARKHLDRPALERLASQFSAVAKSKPSDPDAQYNAALAYSYLAEVAIEEHDKPRANTAAATGMEAAQRAVALKPQFAEYHRLLGTLCGQAISSGGFMGMRY